jgi:hypothetical protein
MINPKKKEKKEERKRRKKKKIEILNLLCNKLRLLLLVIYSILDKNQSSPFPLLFVFLFDFEIDFVDIH